MAKSVMGKKLPNMATVAVFGNFAGLPNLEFYQTVALQKNVH
jgi:hypothetical protein